MKFQLGSCLFALLSVLALPAHAMPGDVSYDPAPPLIDLDYNARFDTTRVLSSIVNNLGGLVEGQQNFESGFVGGQALGDWVQIGNTRVRFGFGTALNDVQWNSKIGQVDVDQQGFSLAHPHGTYGNVFGVGNQPRNYIVDNYYLTRDSAYSNETAAYFVMQFEQPVSTLGFTVIDYANGVGGAANLSLLSGGDLQSASTVFSSERTYLASEPDGSLGFWFGAAPQSNNFPYLRPTFDFAVLYLGTLDAAVGFDNFVVGMSEVPEPTSYAMLLLGFGLLAISKKRRAS